MSRRVGDPAPYGGPFWKQQNEQCDMAFELLPDDLRHYLKYDAPIAYDPLPVLMLCQQRGPDFAMAVIKSIAQEDERLAREDMARKRT